MVVAEGVGSVGVPTVGETVTIRVAVAGPLQPAADAVMVAGPEKAASQSISPVEGLMVPAAPGETE